MDRISANNLSATKLQYQGIARLISDLMNPLVLPPIVIALSSWMLGLSGLVMSSVVGFSLLFYSLIPLWITFYLLRKKRIASLDLPDRKARNPLFIYGIFSATVAFAGFGATVQWTHPLLVIIAAVYLINLLIGFLVNLRWKMSIHTAALASAGAIFFVLPLISFSNPLPDTVILSLTILLLLLPLAVWARYRLSIHTLPELFGGAAAGFMLTVIELLLLNNLW